MNYILAIFDLDGTLLNTGEGIKLAVRHTIDHFHLPNLSNSALNTFIGPPIQFSFSRHYGMEGPELNAAAEEFRRYYAEETLLMAEPYSGVYRMLDELHNNRYKIGIASYKREDYLIPLLKHFRFDRYADCMFGSDMEGKLTKADLIKKCMLHEGVRADCCVMIGDTTQDLEGAQSLGMDFIGVTFGFGFQSQGEIMAEGAVAACDCELEVSRYLINTNS